MFRNVCACYQNTQHQAERINQQVSFSAIDAFSPVIAVAVQAACFNRLAVSTTRTSKTRP